MSANNRPGRGEILRVEPIREKRFIDAIKALPIYATRNLLLFQFGININLREYPGIQDEDVAAAYLHEI